MNALMEIVDGQHKCVEMRNVGGRAGFCLQDTRMLALHRVRRVATDATLRCCYKRPVGRREVVSFTDVRVMLSILLLLSLLWLVKSSLAFQLHCCTSSMILVSTHSGNTSGKKFACAVQNVFPRSNATSWLLWLLILPVAILWYSPSSFKS